MLKKEQTDTLMAIAQQYLDGAITHREFVWKIVWFHNKYQFDVDHDDD